MKHTPITANIRLALAFVLGALALMAAAACAQSEPERASVKLALDWFPNANHTGLFIAQNKGYFDAEGLDVEMYTPSDPSTVLQTVGAGSDHFGMSYQPDVLLARSEGVPVVSVLGVVQHPLNSVMTLATSGLERPAHLKGKKVGYPGIPTNEPLLDTMLKEDGLRGLEDVEMVNIGWNISESLIAEKGTAGRSSPRSAGRWRGTTRPWSGGPGRGRSGRCRPERGSGIAGA